MSYKTPDGRLGGLAHPQPGEWEGYKRFPTDKGGPDKFRRQASRPTISKDERTTHVITHIDGTLETM